jgi:hypothetical protein
MPILPLLVWPLATLGEKAEGSKQKVADNLQPPLSRFAFRVSRPAWLLLALLGALANLPGTFIDFQVYYRNYGLLLAGEPGEAVTIYDPAHSPLLVEAQYLLDGFTAAAYRPSLASAGMPPIWDTIIPLFLVVLSLVSLWFATSPPKRLPAKTPVP